MVFENAQGGIHTIDRLLVAVIHFHGGGNRIFKTDIVNNQTALLTFVHAVYAAYRLNQIMQFHGLVQIHRIKTGDIKARNPHINDNGNFKVALYIFKSLGIILAVIIVAENFIQFFRVVLVVCTD